MEKKLKIMVLADYDSVGFNEAVDTCREAMGWSEKKAASYTVSLVYQHRCKKVSANPRYH